MVLTLAAMVTIFERPLWCLSGTGEQPADSYYVWHKPNVDCQAPNGAYIYLSNFPYLPIGVGVLVELFCYGYLIFAAYLEHHWRGGGPTFWRRFNSSVRLGLATVAAVDALVFFALRQNSFRLAPYCRMVIITLIPWVQEAVRSCVDCVKSFVQVLALLVVGFIFLAWVFAQLLDDWTDEIPSCKDKGESNCPRGNDGFETVGQAIYTMMVVATNGGVPGQSAPNFAYHRFIGLLWATTYWGCNLLTLNVLLATVYNSYSEGMRNRVKAFFRNRAEGLKRAFKILVADPETGKGSKHGITKEQLNGVVLELNKVYMVPHVPENHIEYIFSALDEDNNGSLGLTEFYAFCDVIQYSFARYRTQSYVAHQFPEVYDKLGLHRARELFESPRYAWITLAVTLLNAVFIVWESVIDLNYEVDHPEDFGPIAFAWTEFCFAMVYLFDLLVKVAVLPFSKHFSSTFNRVEAIFTVLLAVMCILWVLPVPWPPAAALRYFNIVRLVTLFGLLRKVGQIGIIFGAILHVVTGTAPVIVLLGVVISLWCILGIQLYGGIIYTGNPRLEGSAIMADHLEVFNYNDFGLSFFSFLSALVAGAPLDFLMDACAITGPGGQPISAVFHMLAYYLLQCIMMNVFTSLVIDAFLTFFQTENISADGRRVEPNELEGEQRKLMELIRKSRSAQALEEEGYELVPQPTPRSTRVYQAMFVDDVEDILSEVSTRG